ncbi:VanW family protein [Sporosarcina cyprini]|uniref:VanW family protein n=1 Tax=Sporosarcina cyprini TaxID=2910523 RepID=UPI001EDDBAEA|nr:VanW family protein [Sporosarcina cyprini]MCG3089259.1 VanW family protein [Sporosarcina cyprini]
MNILIKNKRLSIIVTIIVLIIVFSSIIGAGITSATSFFNKHYPPHTIIGNYDISGLTTSEAKAQLASDVTALHDEMELSIVYLDETAQVPKEIVAFNVEKSVVEAQPGEENPLYSIVSADGLETVLEQQFGSISFSKESIEIIAEGIAEEMQSAIFPHVVYITDYMTKADRKQTIVASASYSIDHLSPVLVEAIRSLDGVEIKGHQVFDLMDELGEAAVAPLSDEELTILASTLYQAVLQTNFAIEERAISSSLPPSIEVGFEAAVNRRLGIGFSFRNPNKADFVLRTEVNANELRFSIEGLPFVYQYESYVERVDTYKPRIIKQFSAFIQTGQVVEKETGTDGLEAIVQRALKQEGVLVEMEPVSKDFYAPVPRVELHPLVYEKEAASKPDTTDSETVTVPGGNEVTSDSPSTPTQTEGSQEEVTSGQTSTETPSTGSDGQQSESQEGIIYDKGGMPVNK